MEIVTDFTEVWWAQGVLPKHPSTKHITRYGFYLLLIIQYFKRFRYPAPH